MGRLMLLITFAILAHISGVIYADPSKYRSVGCWKDEMPRALVLLEGKSSQLNGNYKFRANPVKKCSLAASEKGLGVFALQDGGQCFGSLGGEKYKKYGTSTKCTSKKGGPMANDVYKFEPCMFSDGDVKGGSEKLQGFTDTEQECAEFVKQKNKEATGASWSPHTNQCWMEFGDELIASSVYRACLF